MIPSDLINTFQDAFDSNSFHRGAHYYNNHRVQALNVDADHNRLTGRVRGSGNRIYSCIIDFYQDEDRRPRMVGRCSCPLRGKCKHVAAILFAAQARQAASNDRVAILASPDLTHNALPPQLINWLTDADRVQEQVATDEPYCLLYQLEIGVQYHRRVLLLRAQKVRRTVDGGFGKRDRYSLAHRSQARFVTTADHRIMAMTTANARSANNAASHDCLRLDPEGGADLLKLLAESGRAYWQPQESLLHWEPPLEGELGWELQQNATLELQLHSEHIGAILLPTDPPCWLDPVSGACGLLRLDCDPATAALLAQAPVVPTNAIDGFRRLLRERAPQLKIPLPPTIEQRQIPDAEPVPTLELWSEHREVPRELRHWGISHAPGSVDGATFSFRYGGRLLPHNSPDPSAEDIRDGMVIEYRRNRLAEIDACAKLQDLGFVLNRDARGGIAMTGEESRWLDIMAHALPQLRQKGWEIRVAESFRFQFAEIGDWEFEVDEDSQGAWFRLALGVEIDGQRVDLLPLLVKLMQDYREVFTPAALAQPNEHQELPVKLPDGRYVMMPIERVRPLLTTLIELYDDRPLDPQGRLRLARSQRGELAELDHRMPDVRWSGAAKALEWGRRLRDFEGIEPVEPPASLNAELRPYQRKGLDWLQFLVDFELGGVLADDMGLGKTIQCLAHLLAEKRSGRADRPSLVVAPTSLMFNWRREAERFTPELKVLLLQGADRRASFSDIPNHDLVLTTYPLLPRDFQELAAYPYHLLILDEAQAVKNPRSKAAEAVRVLNARHRLCLTGTPLENHLGELWALIDFLMPGLLGDERHFRRLFRQPIERHGDQSRAEQLRRRVAPFLLRRTKEEVAPELPPKTEILREVALSGDQRDLYETLRLAMHDRVRKEVERKGLSRSGIVILDALLKLRQVCCDPRLVPLESARIVKQSAKLELLLELLTDLLDEGRRILLFSQFASMLDLIEGELQTRMTMLPDRHYVKLTGRTRNRDLLVDRFQSGEAPLFLISLKAGGSGLNLTAADSVIHYDPWWNPAAERQATDRAHRIGQDKPVFVYKLLTESTVEQKVAELQARKQALADAMLAGGAGAASSLTAADLDLLFSPIAD